MTSGRRILVALATAALLVPVLPPSPSLAESAPPGNPSAGDQSGCIARIGKPSNGADAVDGLGDDLAAVAVQNGMSATRLSDLLRTDSTLWVDTCGRLFYVDPARPKVVVEPTPLEPMVWPTSQTFLLHSRAGSKRVIYLDFDGHTVTGTVWNDVDNPIIIAPRYDTDGNPAAFSETEKAEIQNIWARVAEDFAPFEVDVTTQDPGAAAIDRSSAADTDYGTRAVITSYVPVANCGGCGGIAVLGAFDKTSQHAFLQPAWAFQTYRFAWPKNDAETVSHEVGHNLGLSHDGVTGGDEYYDGHASWAPIMGGGGRPITQWSKGEYAGASNSEDDFAVVQANGALLRVDDFPNTSASAFPLDGSLMKTGVIASSTDSDWFSFSGSGPTTITVTPANVSPDLDVGVELWNSTSTQKLATAFKPTPVAVTDDVATGMDAMISTTLPPAVGTYRLRVYGVGAGTGSTGFTSYASVGRYTVAVETVGTPITGTDFALKVTDSPDPVAAAEWVTYTATVTNNGPVGATATLVDALPAAATFGSAVPSQGSCSGTITVTCKLGPIQNGESADVTIRVWFGSPGTFNNSVTVSNAHDPNTANNTVSSGTTVTPILQIVDDSTVEAGTPRDITVSAINGNFDPFTGYTGTVHFTSSDPTLVLPPNYTFTPGDAGSHVFSVILTTEQSITVTDTSSASSTATETFYVVPGALAKFEVTGLVTPRASGTKGDLSVAATDVYGNLRGDYLGTVHFTSSDPKAVLPPNYTFTEDDWFEPRTFPVTLNTLGSQSVTVTDTGPLAITGTQAGIVVTSPFTDIAGSPFRSDIEWVYLEGITSGCTATLYCPVASVTRGQMASFLARALHLSGSAPDAFTDDETSIHEPNINLVAQAGIASGCALNKFCPEGLVSREQMASFLARALHLSGAAPDAFTDDETSIHEPNINLVARDAIATGCGNNKYCPLANVTRGQMAAFLHRAFD